MGNWRKQVAQAAADRCAVLANDHDFDREKDLTFEGVRARSLLEAAQRPDAPGRSALLGSLFSDGTVKDQRSIRTKVFALEVRNLGKWGSNRGKCRPR
jgi:hypothetical protein